MTQKSVYISVFFPGSFWTGVCLLYVHSLASLQSEVALPSPRIPGNQDPLKPRSHNPGLLPRLHFRGYLTTAEEIDPSSGCYSQFYMNPWVKVVKGNVGSRVGHGVCSLHRDQLLLRRQCKETVWPDVGELLSLKST